MSQLLKSGQSVVMDTSRSPCRVDSFLGGGGQGEVYKAVVDGHPVALKWYFPQSATEPQRKALDLLIRRGAPNNQFLWPMELASAPRVGGFGYVMPLREARYKGIVDMMKRRVVPTFRALTTAGFNLADSYWQLHSRGLCYRDISFGNVFFDPTTGDTLICDNDNVTIDGSEGYDGVNGTPRFMAPEIVCGKARPSKHTDQYSLAVLLFYMFTTHHPLEGKREAAIKCMDLPAMNQLYGNQPLFIYDPKDDSNRPVKGFHDNAIVFWPIYPEFLRHRFTEAFTSGIRDPENGRVGETVWRGEMVKLRDSIIYCQCGAENFYDPTQVRESGGKGPSCWGCQKEVSLPPRIRIDRDDKRKVVVMLNHDTKLFPHHVDDNRMYDFSQPIAEVSQHPTSKAWGLRNLGASTWTAKTKSGAVNSIEPGRGATLALGTRIHFGTSEGEINV